MPVTVYPSENPPRPWNSQLAKSPADLFAESCPEESEKCKGIMRSSFSDVPGASISSSKNGFVYAAYQAYSNHHHLSLRPEDIWFAILTQLSFYINGHAEQMRPYFVAHQDKKELVVAQTGTSESADFGKMALQMTDEMEKHIIDPELRQWVLPDFSTTEQNDVVTAAVLMMGSMQKYFSFTFQLICGIPSVTLLGEREDWVKILERLEKPTGWGEETTKFAQRLKLVLQYFIYTFDEPSSDRVRNFWSLIAAHKGNASGPRFLSGWITAFCTWSEDGGLTKSEGFGAEKAQCYIDETHFPPVDSSDVPAGYASVPVEIDDNGQKYKSRMLAGSVGIAGTSSGQFLDESRGRDIARVGKTTGLDTVKPVSGWWMYKVEAEEK